MFKSIASSNGIPGDGPFEPESHDAVALCLQYKQGNLRTDL